MALSLPDSGSRHRWHLFCLGERGLSLGTCLQTENNFVHVTGSMHEFHQSRGLDHPGILWVIFKQCNNIFIKGLITERVVDKAPFLVRTEGEPRLKDISSV
jgi:hypothetical protein